MPAECVMSSKWILVGEVCCDWAAGVRPRPRAKESAQARVPVPPNPEVRGVISRSLSLSVESQTQTKTKTCVQPLAHIFSELDLPLRAARKRVHGFCSPRDCLRDDRGDRDRSESGQL